jgi:hypothetical protein
VATSGLPQGSHLGPVLFLVFINDIVNKFTDMNVLLFADDLKLYSKVSNIQDCFNIQRNLDNLYDWCVTNHLYLNIEKCQYIQFGRGKNRLSFDYTINGEKLEKIAKIKDLGVVFDDKLSFIEHINEITGAAMRTLGFVLRTVKDFNNINFNN